MTAVSAARVAFSPASQVAHLLFGDAQEMHGFTMRAVSHVDGPSPREQTALLWRTDVLKGRPTLTVQSSDPAADYEAWRRAPGVSDVTVVPDVIARLGKRLTAGSTLRFMVRANATRVITSPEGSKRRVPVTDHDALIAWLARQGEGAFTLATSMFDDSPDVAVETEGLVKVQPRGATFGSVSFRGTLVVQDETQMKTLIATGLGRGKAFGFGLLQVA